MPLLRKYIRLSLTALLATSKESSALHPVEIGCERMQCNVKPTTLDTYVTNFVPCRCKDDTDEVQNKIFH